MENNPINQTNEWVIFAAISGLLIIIGVLCILCFYLKKSKYILCIFHFVALLKCICLLNCTCILCIRIYNMPFKINWTGGLRDLELKRHAVNIQLKSFFDQSFSVVCRCHFFYVVVIGVNFHIFSHFHLSRTTQPILTNVAQRFIVLWNLLKES